MGHLGNRAMVQIHASVGLAHRFIVDLIEEWCERLNEIRLPRSRFRQKHDGIVGWQYGERIFQHE